MKVKNITILMISFAVVLNLVVFHQVIFKNNLSIYQEGHFMENLQAVSYLGAGLILILVLSKNAHFIGWLTIFFSVTCFTLFLREVDVEDYNLPSIIKWLASGSGRNLIITAIYLSLIGYFLRHYRHLFGELKYILKSKISIFAIVGCAFLVAGAVFEKLDRVFLEEVAEMNGAFFIMLAAVIHVFDPSLISKFCTQPLTSR